MTLEANILVSLLLNIAILICCTPEYTYKK